MATFDYIARKPDGEKITGRMQADSVPAVARSLDEQELFPVKISEHRDAGGSGFTFSRHGVKPSQVGMFYGQLGDLLNSGVPMMRSLNILGRAGLSAAMKQLVAEIRDDVSAGQTLAEAMGKRPEIFKPLHLAVITAGERAGFLEDSLMSLADYIERQDDLRSKIRGAMLYPAVLVGVGVTIVSGMLIFLVPKFKGMFGEMDLPMPTRVLFSLSDLLRDHFGVMAGLALLAVLGIRFFVRSDTGARLWENWRLHIPVAGYAAKMLGITRFCRVLGAMLANGVPILEALAISRDAVGSKLIAVSISKAAENVRDGKPLAEPLSQDGLFPPEIVEMIAVGEESNQLEKVLSKTAETYERRTARLIDNAIKLIEPLILVMLAMTIGFVAIGILYPIMTMSDTLK